MTGTDVATPMAQLPAHLQGQIGKEDFDEFAGGVTSSFPMITYRGRVWRVKKSGEEQIYLNEKQEAVQSVEIVFLKSNPVPSKVHYEDKYKEGDSGPPRCWSAGGVKPDSNVTDPIHPVCSTCPNNVWGSKITEAGKPTRACSDVRRTAVAMAWQLAEVEAGTRAPTDVDVFLLRVPPASLNPLKDYAEKVLQPKGIAPYMLVTQVGFDNTVSYPKLTFKALRFLDGQEFAVASTLRNGPETGRILQESTEMASNDEAGTTVGQAEVSAAPAQPAAEVQTPAPAPSSKPAAKPTPVEEEEMFSDMLNDIAPPAEPPRAADVETAAEVVEDIAPAPPAPEPVKESAPVEATRSCPSTPRCRLPLLRTMVTIWKRCSTLSWVELLAGRVCALSAPALFTGRRAWTYKNS